MKIERFCLFDRQPLREAEFDRFSFFLQAVLYDRFTLFRQISLFQIVPQYLTFFPFCFIMYRILLMN